MLSTPPSADILAAPAHPGAGDGAPFARSLPWLLLVGGLTGALAAFVLTVEKFALAADSSYVPT